MTNRDWFCLALRVFGIWLLIMAIEEVAPYVMYYLTDQGLPGSYVFGMLIWCSGRTAFGLVLLWFAPAIAVRFYPARDTVGTVSQPDDANALRIGLQLIGVLALLKAVEYASGVVVAALFGEYAGNTFGNRYSDSQDLGSVIPCGLHLAFGLILLIWNERVVAVIEKFRYVAERDAYQPPPSDDE